MRILITGPDGQIGGELVDLWPATDEVVPISIAEMDFTDASAIRRKVRDIKPDLIVNAAGYTAVDLAETEHQIANAINATAVGILGEEAKRLGAAVVHYSTDYVFDGRKRTPYTPDDQPNPQSVYAQSKFDGEIALRESGAAHLILRTSWIYGARGRNFLLAVLRQALVKSELRIVSDQTGCPTWCQSVAQATIEIVRKAIAGKPGAWSFCGREGIYHICSGGSTTWFDFANRIFDFADFVPRPLLTPITTAQYGAPAARPAYSVMDCAKAHDAFGVLIADWAIMLEEILIRQRAVLARILSA
jgi:dTDP-4-dehydrorhamnose reductase